MLIPLLKNSIYCENCKTEIESKTVHNYIICKCKGQKQVSTDGGMFYQHYGYGDKAKYKITSVYDNGKLETRLKYLKWGTFGVSGNKFEWKFINELTDEHLCAILNTQKNISALYRQTIEDLLIERERTNTMI